MLEVRPLTLRQANELVWSLHRHHRQVTGHRFSIGCFDDGRFCGACIVGRPVAPELDPYQVAEVTRLVTDGTKNACSILYAAAARACKAMGYKLIQTYILETEPGTSLKASGWVEHHKVSPKDWNDTSDYTRRGRRRQVAHLGKTCFQRELNV